MPGRFIEAEWSHPDRPGAATTYQAWLPDPIADAPVELTSDAQRAADDIAEALAVATHSEAGQRRAQAAATLLRVAEAHASSKIENIHASSFDVFAEMAAPGCVKLPAKPFEFDENMSGVVFAFLRKSDPKQADAIVDWFRAAAKPEAVASVLRNVAANDRASALARAAAPVTTDTFCDLHAVLTDGLPDYHHEPGALRDTQNWIGRHFRDESEARQGPGAPGVATYIPPPAKHLRDLLDDLAAFCNREDLNPVVRAAVAHARFEEIHPFPDGNGRTGRALLLMLLGEWTLPVSVSLLERKDLYFNALNAFRDESDDRASEVVAFFCDAIERALLRAEVVGDWLIAMRDGWLASCPFDEDTLEARLLSGLLNSPVLTSRIVAQDYDTSPSRGLKALKRFERAGVLAGWKLPDGKTSYVHQLALNLFDDEFIKAPSWVDMTAHYVRVVGGDPPLACPPDAQDAFRWDEPERLTQLAANDAGFARLLGERPTG